MTSVRSTVLRNRPALVLCGLLLVAGILPAGPVGLRLRSAGLLTTLGAALGGAPGTGDGSGPAGWREERDLLRAKVERLQRENRDLRSAQGLGLAGPGSGLDAVAVNVLARDLHRALRSSASVDRGSDDGVRRDMAALSGGCLAGFVTDTGPGHARVQFLDDPGVRVAVEVLGADVEGRPVRVEGAVVGRGRGALGLRLVPSGSVKPGDLVVTAAASASRVVPAGIPVGVVGEVRELPREGLAEAVVEPSADLEHSGFLLLVAPEKHRLPGSGR